LFSRTKYEKLQYNKEQFKTLMPVLSGLNAEEQRALIHYLENSQRSKQVAGSEDEPDFYDRAVSRDIEKRLAKISEEENYLKKNRYRFQAHVMNYAEPERMPVDERKVRDMLRNQHIFRNKINKEVGTYTDLLDIDQIEHGILTYINEAAYGEMRDLLNDIGLKDETIPFTNYAKLKKWGEQSLHEGDSQFHYLMNALFTPVDMTDYQDQFVGWNEIGGNVPINRQSWLLPFMPERHPQTD